MKVVKTNGLRPAELIFDGFTCQKRLQMLQKGIFKKLPDGIFEKKDQKIFSSGGSARRLAFPFLVYTKGPGPEGRGP